MDKNMCFGWQGVENQPGWQGVENLLTAGRKSQGVENQPTAGRKSRHRRIKRSMSGR